MEVWSLAEQTKKKCCNDRGQRNKKNIERAKKRLFKEGQRLITSLTWACCLTVLALVAKSSVERDWTNSVDEIVAMIVVLKKSEALRNSRTSKSF